MTVLLCRDYEPKGGKVTQPALPLPLIGNPAAAEEARLNETHPFPD